MLKQALLRGCLSYCICVTVADFAALIVVLCGGQSTVPGFVTRAGGEIVAAFLQPLLIGWIGFAFAAGSVLFEIERWSFLQQGLAHLAVTLPVFIAVCMFFFAFSTIIGWYFFGQSNFKALFGEKLLPVYSVIVVAFILVGSTLKVDLVWALADLFNGLMAIPNLLALLALSGVVVAIDRK